MSLLREQWWKKREKYRGKSVKEIILNHTHFLSKSSLVWGTLQTIWNTPSANASADNATALKFPDIWQRLIGEDALTEQQIFNVDETKLFWKIMPARTYAPKSERSQPERLTFLLRGNAASDMKLKPRLTYIHTYMRA